MKIFVDQANVNVEFVSLPIDHTSLIAGTARLIITIGERETIVDLSLSGHDVRYGTQNMHGRLEFRGHSRVEIKQEAAE